MDSTKKKSLFSFTSLFNISNSKTAEKRYLRNKISKAIDFYNHGLMMKAVDLLEPYVDELSNKDNPVIENYDVLNILITAEFIIGRYEKSCDYAELMHTVAIKEKDNLLQKEYLSKSLFYWGVLSLKKNEILVASQCFENAIDIISESEHILPFNLLAQTYLMAAKAYALSDDPQKMFQACKNFDGIISSLQNKPFYISLALYKESIMALYSLRLGFPGNANFAFESYLLYRSQITDKIDAYYRYFEILEKASTTIAQFLQESNHVDGVMDNYQFAFSLANHDHQSVSQPNDLIWLSY